MGQLKQEKGPLPRTREAVDWWLRKWGRTEPLIREDVERLVEVNGGTAVGVDLSMRDMSTIDLMIEDQRGVGIWFDLGGGHLREANLQGARLALATLTGADLSRTNLGGANLIQADLRDADLSQANLQGACLSDAILQGADLTQAQLQGAELIQADLHGADLAWSNLQGTDLRNVNLQGANLQNASISADTNLEGVRWDEDYIGVLERKGRYVEASSVYRRLKRWYEGAGMPTIAGEFHYREREVSRKALWQKLRLEFKEFKQRLSTAWQNFKGE